MAFVRSLPAPQLGCTFGYGEQMNQGDLNTPSSMHNVPWLCISGSIWVWLNIFHFDDLDDDLMMILVFAMWSILALNDGLDWYLDDLHDDLGVGPD